MQDKEVSFEELAAIGAAVETQVVSELIGISRLLIFSGQVTEDQRRFLHQWEQKHSMGLGCWPLPQLRVALDEKDDDELFFFLMEIVRLKDKKNADADFRKKLAESPIESIFDDPVPEIVFCNAEFEFTGNCENLSRNDCYDIVRALEGIDTRQNNECKYFLIVGSKGSKYWVQKNFGRKIQNAMHENAKYDEDIKHCGESCHKKTFIIREKDWLAAIEKFCGMSAKDFLEKVRPYKPSSYPQKVTVDWENHARRVLEDVFGELPPVVEYEQGKTLFKIFHPCKPKEVILKLRYGSYGITRLTGADGDELYEVGSGYCAGKKILEKYRKMLWGEI
ncbi:hypothetical protein [Desulfovibrio piger]|uniref:hypothetical protein n=1 Tax=Desulfovibrio piger TaxID=901 RepID=UPI0024309CF1|nr:hypothetical protein [Desulfovibrio piger]MCI7508038.1 hypothetical protein [Desulfovibrio piger]